MRDLVIIFLIVAIGVASPVSAKPGADSGLPPGLEKRLEQGKPLPPGWARKLSVGAVLDERIVDRGEVVVPLDDDGVITLAVEGETFRLIEATREIVEILGH
jgi:hypothetical protein